MSTDFTSAVPTTPAPADVAAGSDDTAVTASINGAEAGSVDTVAGSYEPERDAGHTNGEAEASAGA